MNTRGAFLHVLLLFYINQWYRTEGLQINHSSNNIDGNDKNALFDVIRRVENMETTNKYIIEENKQLRDDVTSLKKQISTMKASHEATVEFMKIQINEICSELSYKNKEENSDGGRLSDTNKEDHAASDKESKKKDNDSVTLNDDVHVPSTPHINASTQANHVDDMKTMENEKRKDLPVTKSEKRFAFRNKIIEGNVAFFATVGKHHIQHAGVNQTLVFDDVITNHGNAYSKFAGDFRAPVDGTYVFSVTLMAYGANSGHYSFEKNGVPVAMIYVAGQESAYSTSAMTTILDLQPGDDVSIKNNDLDKNLHGYAYSTFSGFLLQGDFSSQVIVGK